jgi:class 3 adenylate cyclase
VRLSRRDVAKAPSYLTAVRMHPITLRFLDSKVEEAFRGDYFRHAVSNFRAGLAAGIFLWIFSIPILHPSILALNDRSLDLLMRFGVFIPILLLGIALSFTPIFERIWEWVTAVIALSTMGSWVYYIGQVLTIPPEYGYIGVILITSFTYALLRLRFILVVLITIFGVALYLPYAVEAVYIFGIRTALAVLFLVSFGVVGSVAAYRMERSQRILFLRERQIEVERERSDRLLLNILPQVIIDRLKQRSDGRRIADALPEVTVVFADVVDSTREAVGTPPEEFAALLDTLFSTFDRLADRHGLEKIKTIGDAYMAVAGAPLPVPDSAGAGAEMALDMMQAAHALCWPSGKPVELHIGMATGPAVAGVIGQRKFAYDLWGDTVNLAARLQESAEPGQILVSWTCAQQLEDRYALASGDAVEVKGRGTTPVRALLGRISEKKAQTANA